MGFVTMEKKSHISKKVNEILKEINKNWIGFRKYQGNFEFKKLRNDIKARYKYIRQENYSRSNLRKILKKRRRSSEFSYFRLM